MNRRDAVKRIAAASAAISLPALAQGSRIVLGQSAAFSGPAAQLGIQMNKGGRIYFDSLNASGGIHGAQIELRTLDDGYVPDRCKATTEKFIKDDVFGLFGYVGTPTCLAALPLVNESKIPFFGPFTGAEALREPFSKSVFHVRASYYDEARAQVDILVGTLGMKKVAVFYQEDAFGVAVLEGVKIALKKHNLEPVALGTYPRNTMDIAQGMEQIKPAQPEAVVMVGTYAPLAEFVKRARADKWKSQFLTVSFVGTEAFAKAAGKDGEGVIITQVVPPPIRKDLPGVSRYVTALKKYFPEANPNFVSLEGFVDAMVLVEGLKQAGRELSREKLLTAIEGIRDLDLGIGMKASYSATRHHAFDAVYYTILRDGEPTIVTDWKLVKK